MKNKHRFMCGLCAAVIACCTASAVIRPVSVYAQSDEDFEQSELFQDWLGDRIADIGDHWTRYLFMSNDPNLAALGTVAYAVSCQNGWYRQLKNAVDADVELNSDGAVYAGYYRIEEGGQIYPGTISMHSTISGSGTDVVKTSHFSFTISFDSSNIDFNPTNLRFDTSINGDKIDYYAVNNDSHSCKVHCFDGNSFLTGSQTINFIGNSSRLIVAGLGTSSEIPVIKQGSNFSRNGRTWLGSGSRASLPDLGVPMSYAEPWEYYNALVDYLDNNYDLPEGIVGVPYNPYSPEYPDPSDYYPGIPNSWTVENPQLPDIQKKNLTLPEFSWDSIDLSGIQEVSHGVGFWWALLGKAFDDFHLLPVVLLVVGLAVVGFVLWKLGG